MTEILAQLPMFVKLWLLIFVAAFPVNLGLGRYGLGPMTYGQYIGQLIRVAAFLATAVTGGLLLVAWLWP